MTVSALLIRRVDAGEALRLSFLMSVPVTVAVVAYEVATGGVGSFDPAVIVSGVLASFVLGYVTIDGLMTLARRVRWDLFCIAIGALALVAGALLLLG